jgi:hypothetical protein
MGAQRGMYDRLYRINKAIIGCDWPVIAPGFSFSDLADECIKHYNILGDDTVAGSSMGGMVAAEIHRKVRCRRCLMIGSTYTPRKIPLGKLAPLGNWMINDRMLSISASSVPCGTRIKSSLLSNPNFVKESIKAFVKWDGLAGSATENIKSIHGMLDFVIPIFTTKADVTIASGGHLIAITHFKAVNEFILNYG